VKLVLVSEQPPVAAAKGRTIPKEAP